MKIEDNAFFMVQISEEKTLHQNEDDAIQHLQEQADSIDPDSEEVNIVRVSIENEDWTIAEMPWQKIALQLMGN